MQRFSMKASSEQLCGQDELISLFPHIILSKYLLLKTAQIHRDVLLNLEEKQTGFTGSFKWR